MHSGMSHLYSRTSPRNQESDSDLLLHVKESHTTEPHCTRTSLRTPSPFPTSITTHARKKSNKDKKLKKSTPTHRENGKWEYGNTGAESHRLPQPTESHSPQAPTESRLQELQGLQHMDPWAQKSKSLAAPAPFRVPPLRRRENPNTQPPQHPPSPPAPPAPNTQHSAHVYETRLGNDKKSLGFCKQKSLAEDKLLQPTQQTTTNYYYKLLHNKLQQTTSCYYYHYYKLPLLQASTSTSTTICCKAVML